MADKITPQEICFIHGEAGCTECFKKKSGRRKKSADEAEQ